jgi:hypothetical protein
MIPSQCDKKNYTKKEAQTVLNSLQKMKSFPKYPKWVYQCEECNYWHITSKKK